MALRRNSNKEGFALELTTCSDIIFTLLLFYILTQNFMPQTSLELPSVGSLEQPGNSLQQRIEISAEGGIIWNGSAVDYSGLQTMVEKISVVASGSQIIILAHRQSPAGVTIELLDKMRRAGISSISFAGAPPESSPDLSEGVGSGK